MAQVLAKCDLFRAQIAHLRTVFPYVHVAPYTRDLHTVKVYVDLQWRCQVFVIGFAKTGFAVLDLLTGVAIGTPQIRWNLEHRASGS